MHAVTALTPACDNHHWDNWFDGTHLAVIKGTAGEYPGLLKSQMEVTVDKKYRYQATAHWTLHKRGIVEADESIPRTINFAAPPEFGGEPGMWTPEHLLLAGVATCYVATFRGISKNSKLEFQGLEVQVEGTIEKQEGGLRFTRIELRPVVSIHREQDRELAGRLLEKAERSCLIARSIQATFVLEPKILIEEPVGAES